MPTASKQEQRDEARRLFAESIRCQQQGHARGERGVVYKMGDICPHCEDPVGDPLLERIPAAERPQACEDNGGHEIAPKTWPPDRRYSSSKRPPALNARCRRCRANIIAYDPVQTGIKVYSPDWKRVIAGQSPKPEAVTA